MDEPHEESVQRATYALAAFGSITEQEAESLILKALEILPGEGPFNLRYYREPIFLGVGLRTKVIPGRWDFILERQTPEGHTS
jgi:hypothetical protein